MFSQLRNIVRLCPVILQPQLKIFNGNFVNAAIKNFSSFNPAIQSTSIVQTSAPFLQPSSTLLNAVRGMKMKGHLRLRCKDCYFVRRFQRLFVMCKAKPRHKQMSMKKKPINTWTMVDATQSKKRAW
jgi:large subunit ribosomal protein L36